jgi:hypothetical protein
MNSSAILLFLLVLCTRGGQKILWWQVFEMAREYFGLDRHNERGVVKVKKAMGGAA